jgi:DNA-binding MarR family transcriptional regulator
MNSSRALNVIGALSLAVADDIVRATSALAPEPGPAGAAIVLIGHEPGISIRALASGVGLSHAGAVRLVDRLVADGLAERRSQASDRRERALHLTDLGRRRCDAILGARDGVLSRGLAALGSDEVVLLAGLAERLLRAAVTDEAGAYRVCRLCNFAACTECPVDNTLASMPGAT